ncbi:helix-turn-helix transcriptional regulator [Myxococcota bacterium]|nr:helix-turn-helix transcriptional regulator [Myxococcota bacterium]
MTDRKPLEEPSREGPPGDREVPRPGQIFDPVARALERIGDRWTLVLLRQLLGGAKGFQELRQRTGIAPRVLSARLRQLAEEGWVESVPAGETGVGEAPRGGSGRSLYAVTSRGRTLEPIIAAIARWWVRHAMEEHIADVGPFTETSAQSILESLPFLLRDENARGAAIVFEIRLSGPGGGVWTIRIADQHCTVTRGFADGADVRYTAEARVWCGVALGLLDSRDAIKRGLLTKEGGRAALDHYFHQIPRPSAAHAERAEPGRRKPQRRTP